MQSCRARTSSSSESGRIEPWELALAIGILVVSVAVAALIAVRVYRAGMLLFGQRPGLRMFLAAARTAD